MSQEEENQQRLEAQREVDEENNRAREASRKKKSLLKLAGEVAREAGISNPRSLAEFIEIRDIFFAIAIMSSLLKDILDPFGSALFGLCIVTGLMASGVTVASMFVCGAGLGLHAKEKSLAGKIMNKWSILAAGTIFEMIPMIDFLPIETVTTFVIFIYILKERRAKAIYLEQQKALAQMASVYA